MPLGSHPPEILNLPDMTPPAVLQPKSIRVSALNQIAIVLMEPKFPENIGAAARIAWNMGMSRLIVVRREAPDYESMAKMATHKAVHLIDTMELHQDLGVALAPFSCVVGTTARRGRQRILEKGPREVVQEIAPLLQMTSAIPTAGFSSLNLAQAVAVHCYEIYYGLIHAKKDILPAPKFASTFELEGMYTHVEEALLKIDFLQDKNHSYWMNNIRQFLSRIRLSSKDTNIIRGICRQFLWHQGSPEKTTTHKD